MQNDKIDSVQKPLETGFSGRLIQVTEALDSGDAVSNQIVDLDRMFKRLGLDSMILSKWHSQDVEVLRKNFDDVEVTEKDIVIFHFCGHSEFAGPWTLEQYCTRVMFYHNITPHHFFPAGSALYEFCKKGREQLKEIVPKFHAHWGASAYNLEELHEAGADPAKSFVIPIIVPEAQPHSRASKARAKGHWLFVGRIVSNKCQMELIDLFAAARRTNPAMAENLTFVGRYNPGDAYYKQVINRITKLKLNDHIKFTGKISDFDRENYFRRSQFYVSISEHEGFGVPLVEAPLRGLPVVALDRAAAVETTGGYGLSEDRDSLIAMIQALFENDAAYTHLVDQQRANAARFSEASVETTIRQALAELLPKKNTFKNVSIVICTYNRIDHLRRCLDYLRFQSNPNFEIIVVNGPSNDGTKEFLEENRDILKIYENPYRNLSISRNIGIENSAGDIVAFIDDDAIPFDNWVDHVLRAYNERPLTVAALGGPVFFAGTLRFQSEDIGIDVRAETRERIKQRELGKNGLYRANLGTNSTFVRATVAHYGGFDEQFDYFLDESELCLRLQLKGHLVGYCPDVLVRHEFAQSHNRQGKYVYDWKTICKNITYFVAAYSGLGGRALRNYLEQRLSTERVTPLRGAFENGEISAAAYDQGVQAIWEGLEQGLSDVESWPKTRAIEDGAPAFLPFAIDREYRAVGRDLPQMHIGIVSKEFPPFTRAGGVGTLYYHLVSELLLMGHKISIIIPSQEDANRPENKRKNWLLPKNSDFQQGPLTICYTSQRGEAIPDLDKGFSDNANWSLNVFARLAKLNADHPFDVIDSALWDTEALAFSTLPRESRPPLVVRLVTPFEVVASINQWATSRSATDAFNAAEKALITNADAIIPISRKIASTITTLHGVEEDERWDTAPCGIAYWPLFDVRENYAELDKINDLESDALEKDKIVLFIGRLELRKGVDILFDALEKILSQEASARVIIAGKDDEGWETEVLASLPEPLASRVHFLGNVPDAIRDKLLAHAYCLVFPSRYESFGLVPLEAFVHKVPVVASRSGAIPEVVLDGECGLLFDEDDSDQLAEMVLRLLKDQKLHTRLSDGAERRVHELSSRNSAIHTVGIYRRLLDPSQSVISRMPPSPA